MCTYCALCIVEKKIHASGRGIGKYEKTVLKIKTKLTLEGRSAADERRKEIIKRSDEGGEAARYDERLGPIATRI